MSILLVNPFIIIMLMTIIMVIILLIVSVHTFYLPGLRIVFMGTRNYRIIFKYGDLKKLGLQDVNQAEKVKYILNKIVEHISGTGLTEFFPTKDDVQILAEEYYYNLQAAYSLCKDYRKHRLSQKEYETSIAVVERENTIILKKFQKLNQETVDFINYLDDCIEEGIYDIDYDFSGINDYLKDEDDHQNDECSDEEDEEDEKNIENEDNEEDNQLEENG